MVHMAPVHVQCKGASSIMYMFINTLSCISTSRTQKFNYKMIGKDDRNITLILQYNGSIHLCSSILQENTEKKIGSLVRTNKNFFETCIDAALVTVVRSS